MKKISVFSLISSLLSVTSSLCFAMPTHPDVFSGSAEVQHIDSHTMEIKSSDQAILHYQDFQIGANEKVRFIQNSSKSCVLNRVKGENPSQILGSLESNGKVFLVNPHGIYFGPDSTVNVGSLIASTLDMADEDFLQEKYRFSLSQGNNSSIVNEGLLQSVEGSIVLLAPSIRNLGHIQAKAGTVLLASGEHVTLDFTGDGLIQFSVEGSLKEAVIEHLGEIKGSIVSIKLPTAKKAITEILNMDGAHIGEVFIEENGVIKFASGSFIQAKTVHAEGSQIFVQGSIDASNVFDKGGDVHFFGKDIFLEKAKIDASGLIGGGNVLLGGEFQGKGSTPYASRVLMGEFSEIYADAIEKGDGGLVVLWSQDQTLFDGKIFARGGAISGKGGLVETSSVEDLGIIKGKVNTLDANGGAGLWLLDPNHMNIVGSALSCDNCSCTGGQCPCCFGDCDYNSLKNPSDRHVGPPNFLGLSSDVLVRAYEELNIWDSFSVTGTGGFHPNLTLETCGPLSYIQSGYGDDVPDPLYITTDGGSITIISAGNSFAIRAPNTVFTSNGGDINIESDIVQFYTGASGNVTFNAGSGTVSFNVPYTSSQQSAGYHRVGSVTINSAGAINVGTVNIAGAFTVVPAWNLGGSVSISTNGHDISIGSVNAKSGVSATLNLNAGANNTITLGSVGATNPLSSFTVASGGAGNVHLSGLITTGNISITPPVTSSGSITSQQGSISLLAPLALTLTASNTITAAKEITLAGQIVGDGSSTYTLGINAGSTSPISIGGNISQLANLNIGSGSSVSLYNATIGTGTLQITPPATFLNSSTTLSAAGGTISLQNVVHPIASGNDLVINAGTGSISVNGMGTTGDSGVSFGDIILTGSSININQSVFATDDLVVSNTGLLTFSSGTVNLGKNFTQSGTGAVSLGSSILANEVVTFLGAVTVTSSVTLQGLLGITVPGSLTTSIAPPSTPPTLSINAGSSSFTIGSIGSSSFPFGTLGITASNLSLGGDIITATVTGAILPSIKISCPITVSASSTTMTGPDGITLNGLISTTNLTPPALTLNAGSHHLIVAGMGSSTLPFGVLSLTGTDLTINGDVFTTGSLTFTNQIYIGANVTLQAPTGMTFGTLFSNTSPFDLTMISSAGAISASNLGTGTQPLGNITITSVGLTDTGSLVSSGDIDLEGTFISLGSFISASGDIDITNSGALTIPPGTISVTGDFTQDGAGSVSLGSSISTAGSITFAGSVTISSNITLQGDGGITIPGSITPNVAGLNLNLNAADNPLSVQSLGTSLLPLGILTITASELFLGGDIYTTSLISLSPPVTISGNTSLNTTGSDGIVLAQSVVSSSGNPTLGLIAPAGPIDIKSLGSDTLPLGSVTLNGSFVTLAGDIISVGSLEITGLVTINESVILRGDTGVALNSNLIPSTDPFDLTILATGGSASVRSLGSSTQPLGSLSIIGPVTLGASSAWVAEEITTSSAINGAFALTLDGIDPTAGLVSIGGAIGISTSLSSFTVQNVLSTELSSVFTNGGLIHITSPLLINNHAIINSSGGNIDLDGSVDSLQNTHHNLSMVAGAGGTITIGGDIGKTTALGSFSIMSALKTVLEGSNLITQGSTAIYSPLTSSIPQLTIISDAMGNIYVFSYVGLNSGDAGIQDLILTTSQNVQVGSLGSSSIPLGAISITAANVTLGASIIAQGGLAIENTGLLTIQGAGISLGGAFSQTGSGSVSLGEDISANTISFVSPITLIADSSLESNSDLTLSSSVDGAFAFTLNSPAGYVIFENCIGCTAPVSSLTVQGLGMRFSGDILLKSTGNMDLAIPGEALSVAGASLLIDASAATVNLGPIGLNTALSFIDITAGLLQTQGLAAAGGSIDMQAPVELNSPLVVIDTTRNGAAGGNITFSSTINSATSAVSLSIVSGTGTITLPADIGNTNALRSLSISSSSNLAIQDITVMQNINISAPIILSKTPLTTFTSQNSGNISLGTIDGTTSGAQQFTAQTTGKVSLGVIGANTSLEEVFITTASEVSIQSITTQGVITLSSPIVVTASSTLHSSGNLITLGSIEGTSIGSQSLTVDAGAANALFTGNIGAKKPLGNLSVTAGMIDLQGALLYALGSQSYQGPVQISQSLVFQAQGNVTFYDPIDPVSGAPNLSFYMGRGALTFADSVGDAPFGAISVFNASGFSSQKIFASSLRVTGVLAEIVLHDDVILSGPAGIVLDGRSVQLGGEVDASYLFFRARGSISNIAFPVPLNIDGPNPLGFQYINTIRQNVGSPSSPIEINTPEDLVVGSYFRADFIGDPMHDSVITSFFDPPCVVTFNGVTIINCLAQPFIPDLFPLLPKDLFYLPGIYSSWNNLSNNEYFQQEPANLGENPRARTLFYVQTTGESSL